MTLTRLVVEALIKIAVLMAGLMMAAAYLVLVERRVAAWIQDRRGPNRVGIPLTRIRLFGLGQPIADGMKFIFKEEFTPAHVDKVLYRLAPILMFAAAVAVYAVIPFGSVLPESFGGSGEPIRLVVAPGVDVGMIYIFALSGMAVYGVLLGSWASNNKYSFFGGIRSGAQLVSYELPLGLGLLGVVLMSGSLRLETIIAEQARSGVWNVLVQPLGFFVFAVASWSEAQRLPFDLAECEQELVGGFHTEYSGMKLMLYLVAEYLHMITASFLMVILFFGGWHFWGLTGGEEAVGWPVALLRIAVLLSKVLAVILFFMLARWSWPRFRFDQLMNLAWKALLPLGLIHVVAVAFGIVYGGVIAGAMGLPERWAVAGLGWLVLVGAGLAVVWFDPARADNRPLAWSNIPKPNLAQGDRAP